MAAQSRDSGETLAAAKLAKLRVCLTLSAEQEKYWQALENTARDLAKSRYARRNEVRQARAQATKGKEPVDIASRILDRAKGLRASADRAEKFANAAKPLLDSLNPGQKRWFGILLRCSARRRTRVRRRRVGLTRFLQRAKARAAAK